MMNGLVSLVGAFTLAGSVQAAFKEETSAGFEVLYSEGDFKVLINPSEREKIGNAKPQKGDQVTVHYTGRFEYGSEFDSSYSRDEPFTFPLQSGWVIKCWDDGFLHLSKGMKARLLCPPDFAYGSEGAGGVIPPNASILFDVELIDIAQVENEGWHSSPEADL